MKLAARKNWKEKGVTLILTAVLMMLLVPIIGLALDATLLYAFKAKASTAADAAAIAAARSLSVGLTLAEQEASAVSRAQAFFQANFPANSWWTSNHSIAVTVTETSYRTRTVTINTQLDAPGYFMRFVGLNSITIKSTGKASRRDVNLILVLDRSGSMSGTPCSTMRSAATNFVNMFAEGRDRLAMIAYSTTFIKAFNPSMTFKSGGSSSLPSRIGAIDCNGATNIPSALGEAYLMLQTINEPGTLNLVVFFTDGWPTAFSAQFPIKKKTDNRLGYGTDGYTSTSTEYSMLPSTCDDAEGDKYDRNAGSSTATFSAPGWNPNWTPADRTGVLSHGAGNEDSTGTTIGLRVRESTDLAGGTPPSLSPTSNCRYGANTGYIRRDIAYIPNSDFYGTAVTGFKTIQTFTSSGHPYLGQRRPDRPVNITYSAMNLADNLAATMRNNTGLRPIIYAIGLGDVEETLLRRMANDPTSPIYDSTKPEGLYVYAPTPTELNYAFVRIASEILRIAQ